MPRVKKLSVAAHGEYRFNSFPEFPEELLGSGKFTDLTISIHGHPWDYGSRCPIEELIKWPAQLTSLTIFDHTADWKYQFDVILAKLENHAHSLKSFTVAKQAKRSWSQEDWNDNSSDFGDNTFDLSSFPNLEQVGINLTPFASSKKKSYKKLLEPPQLKHIHWYRSWPAIEYGSPKSTLYIIATHVAKNKKALKSMTLDGSLLVEGNSRNDVDKVGDAVKRLLKLKRALGSLGIDLVTDKLIRLDVDFPRFCRDLKASMEPVEEFELEDLWQKEEDTQRQLVKLENMFEPRCNLLYRSKGM